MNNPNKPLCDFCGDSKQEITYVYPATDGGVFDAIAIADDGSTRSLHAESVGSWAACNTCYKLIEYNARTALAERSADVYMHTYNRRGIMPRSLVLATIHQIQDTFFSLRKTAVPYKFG